LLKSRELSDHIQEHSDQGADGQEKTCYCAVPLARPFCKDESLRTLASNDGTKSTKDQEWESGGEGVDQQALNTGDGGDFWIGEENSGAEGCSVGVSRSARYL
jgi:hypothetical protein